MYKYIRIFFNLHVDKKYFDKRFHHHHAEHFEVMSDFELEFDIPELEMKPLESQIHIDHDNINSTAAICK